MTSAMTINNIMSAQHGLSVQDDKAIKTSYVRKDGQATIICPNCCNAKTISVRRFHKRQYRIKLRCSCSHIFEINLDHRQSYRKLTSFSGTYGIYHPKQNGGQAKVRNISFDGICFEVTSTHCMQIDQKGYIDFTLDNKKKTRLTKEFSVRFIRGNTIGCKFLKDKTYEKDLGFYLRSGL